MNLQQLEYIIALNKYRHFGRAADHCNVSQPTLSTMIQKLEDELGVKLFDRSQQPIKPTDIGQKILHQASNILRQVAVLDEIIKDEEEGLGGDITLAVLPTIAPYLIPRITPLIDRRLPDLKITFIELLTSECIEHLNNGSVDIAIMATELESDGLLSIPVYYEEFYGYISPNETLSNEKHIRSSEIDASRLWLLDEGHCFRDQLLKFCQLRRNSVSKNKYVRGSLTTFMRMVEQGHGMTFIPELSLESIAPQYQSLIHPFAIPRPTRQVRLSIRKDFARMGLAEALCNLIKAAVPEQMLKLQPGQVLA